jgi:hypothetical protein
MPIDPEFPKKPYRITGEHKHADSDYFYLVRGPKRAAEAAENEEVKKFSQARGEHANLRLHEKAARIFNEDLAKTGSLLPHAQ